MNMQTTYIQCMFNLLQIHIYQKKKKKVISQFLRLLVLVNWACFSDSQKYILQPVYMGSSLSHCLKSYVLLVDN